MVSIRWFAFVLLLLTAIFAFVNPQIAVRTYIIQKDLLNPIKAGEFSIFDYTEKQLQYRIESRLTFMQSVELIAYPSKQVVAKLNKNLKLFLYKGTISILDPRSNQWIKGTIHEKLGGKYIIEWNGQRLVIGFSKGFGKREFRDESDSTLLAESLIIKDNILYKLVNSGSTHIRAIYVPSTVISELLAAHHDHHLSGRFGVTHAWYMLRNRYYWPHMKETIVNYIQSCDKCSAVNVNRYEPPGFLQSVQPRDEVFQVLGMDWWGPITTSFNRNKYVFVIIDRLSGYFFC
ncbi:unnamed protein product [Rotaria sp. Silwood2]|nr:unnamed protein product [Rotaria sp. Silwood2]CAF2900530.1 unnamed protein product [Rotaria sp. Silwood2]CAF3979620.1 unnamed protein product [Rotaria sp. Silwood2]CAF4026622.1 unnamed protein product [Rotaria sp. Silwood2]